MNLRNRGKTGSKRERTAGALQVEAGIELANTGVIERGFGIEHIGDAHHALLETIFYNRKRALGLAGRTRRDAQAGFRLRRLEPRLAHFHLHRLQVRAAPCSATA